MLAEILSDNNLLDVIIDSISDIIRNNKIQTSYNVDYNGICKDIDLNAMIDWNNKIASFNFKYRSYPSSNND